jgi:hypothetical protein
MNKKYHVVSMSKCLFLIVFFVQTLSADNLGFICATEKTLSDMRKYNYSDEYIMINHGTSYLIDDSKIYFWGLSSQKWISSPVSRTSNSASWSRYSNGLETMSYMNLDFGDLTLSTRYESNEYSGGKSKCMKKSWNEAMRIAKNWIPLDTNKDMGDKFYFHKSYKEDSKFGQSYRIYKMLQIYPREIESSKSAISYLQAFCDDKSKVFALENRYCSDTVGEKCDEKQRVWQMLEDLPKDSFFRRANERICNLP